jgi:hypothetical protein
VGVSVTRILELSSEFETLEKPEQFVAFPHYAEALASAASQMLEQYATHLNQQITITLEQMAARNLSRMRAALSEYAATLAKEHTVAINAALSSYVKQCWFPYTLKQASDHHEAPRVLEQPEEYLAHTETQEQFLIYSPSLLLLAKLRAGDMTLHDLHWRQLEEIVAELLAQEGYQVTLGPGTKDGGRDITAIKQVACIGQVMSIWQAKKKAPHNKVDLDVIRLLDYTRLTTGASKGIIVTTTSLTRDALHLVNQKPDLLHKVDGNDLHAWIRTRPQP